MFFSLTEIPKKGKPSNSRVLRNCCINESYTTKSGFKASYPNRTLEGTPIEREAKCKAWKVMLNKSYREGGKIKKKQFYLQTIKYWDIIDSYLDYITRWKDEDYGGILLSVEEYSLIDIIIGNFPDDYEIYIDDIISRFFSKFKPIEEAVIAEFKLSEEYHWFKLNQEMSAEIELLDKQDEEAVQETLKKERLNQYFRDYQQEKQQQSQQYTFKFNPQSEITFTLSSDEARVINQCYKAMAVQLHPDKGGSDEDMKILNNLRDKLKQ